MNNMATLPFSNGSVTRDEMMYVSDDNRMN